MSDPAATGDAVEVDLAVVGGGVMGLFTAYHAARRGATVAVFERGRIGDPETASFGRTRSYRRDYLDATYARLADEAMRLWDAFEADTGARALVRCGCMNIATAAVTPELETTYATGSYEVLRSIDMPMEAFDRAAIEDRFPYLDADIAYLDPEAGLVDLPAVTAALRAALDRMGVTVHEEATVSTVTPGPEGVDLTVGGRRVAARRMVVTAGHGTNGVLALIEGCGLQVPITKDRPSEAKYFTPPDEDRARYTSDAMPVIAYLDTGIYLHPIVEGLIDAVKVGYYNPPDVPRDQTSVASIADFVAACMPGLAAATTTEVTDVDQCDYDLVADDDFVLGPVPGAPNVWVGVGWRGTGYKYSPWVGTVLAELALRGGTVYDIARFDPARFPTAPITRQDRSPA
jgi:glycine/D-amino acid oxidase-like deaminating enzyme